MNWCCALWQPATQSCLSTRQGCTLTSIIPRLQQPCSFNVNWGWKGRFWSLPQTDTVKYEALPLVKCHCQFVHCHSPRSDWHVICPLPLPLKQSSVECLCHLSLIISHSSWRQPLLIIRYWPLIRGKHPCTTKWNSCTRSAAICFHVMVPWTFEFYFKYMSQCTSLHRSAQLRGSSWLQRSQAWFCQVMLAKWRQRLLACTRFWDVKILGDKFGQSDKFEQGDKFMRFFVYDSHIWGRGSIVWLRNQVCGRRFGCSGGHGVSVHPACVSMGHSIPMASQLHLIFKQLWQLTVASSQLTVASWQLTVDNDKCFQHSLSGAAQVAMRPASSQSPIPSSQQGSRQRRQLSQGICQPVENWELVDLVTESREHWLASLCR